MRLIDADALMKVYAQYEFMSDMGDAMEILANFPTVDAMPVRHGKYIGTEFDGYADGCPVYYEWKCSECGCVFEEEEPTYNYCPNCGAMMDAERKEE